jgi:hypothetical protein
VLYIGGEFENVGGKARNNLAAVNAEVGTLTSWDPNPDAAVITLALSPDGALLLAAGEFSQIGRAQRDAAMFDTAAGFVVWMATRRALHGPGARSQRGRIKGLPWRRGRVRRIPLVAGARRASSEPPACGVQTFGPRGSEVRPG